MKRLFLAILLLLAGAPSIAQRPALNSPVIRFDDINGKPLVGGKLFSYIAGTTTPSATFVDAVTGALNTNPVILDSTGSARVFLGAQVYKFILQDANGVVQWTADNIGEGQFQGSYVNSVFGRHGDVVAQTGDYTCDQVTGCISTIPTLYNQTVQVAGASAVQEPKLNLIPGLAGGLTGVTVTNGGTGYVSSPTVSFSGGGCAVLSTATSTLALAGTVGSVAVISGGTGYTSAPTMTFSGGGCIYLPTAIANLAPIGSANGFAITIGGSGYTSAPTVTFTGGGCTVEPTGTVAIASGAVVTGTIVTAGSGCTSNPPATFTGGGGTSAAGAATIVLDGEVASATLTSTGFSCTSAPTIAFSGGGGSGAAATTSLVDPTSVGKVTLLTTGSGCSSPPDVAFAGGSGTGAAATAAITPGGIVCVDNPAAGSTDCTFSTSGGGGGGNSVVTDVTTARAFGTIYQNTNGVSLIEFVEGKIGGTGCTVHPLIGLTSPPTTPYPSQSATPSSAAPASGSDAFLVPAGYFFEVTTDFCTLQAWVEATGPGGGSIKLQHNGVDNGSQTLLNLKGGTNITLADDGAGGITINSAGGGATFPSFPTSSLFTYTSTTGGRAAIYADIVPFFDVPVAGADDFYLTTTPPGGTGGGNTLIGVGVGPSMTIGAGAGGEGNTVIGYLAGQHMTTARESTIIGSMAGQGITGNNSGPEDMIFDLIGSDAGAGLTNCGGSGVMIGQKSGVTDTCSSGDVFVGIHTATNTHTSAGNIVTGAFTLDGFTGNLTRNVFVGSNAGQNIATGGTISDTVAIGNTSLNNLDATAGSGGNIAVGSRSGTNCSTCQNNVLIGNSVADSSLNTPVMTGSENVIISTGLSADSQMTSASHNIFIETEQTALTTGTYNFCADQFACAPVTTGSNNVMIGQGAGFFGGNVSDSVALGQSAASHAQNGSQVFIGRFAGQNLIGGTNNTVVGPNSFQTPNSTESNDEAFGAGADMAVGVSNSAQIGTGQNTVSHTLQFNAWNFLTDGGAGTFSSGLFSGELTLPGVSGAATANTPQPYNLSVDTAGHVFGSTNIQLGNNQMLMSSSSTPATGLCSQDGFNFSVGAIQSCNGTAWSTFGGGAPLTNPTGGANNYAPLAAPSFTGGALVTGALTNKQAANTAGSGFNLNSFDGLRSLDCHFDVSDILQCSIGSSRSASFVGNYNFMQQLIASGGIASAAAVSAPLHTTTVGTAIASASTIAPVTGLFHITGTVAIATITPPTGTSSTVGGCITIIPDAVFTTTTGGNISLASTAVVGRALQECYDGAHWFPSY